MSDQEILKEFQLEVDLPGGGKQVIDRRVCYSMGVLSDGSWGYVENPARAAHENKPPFSPKPEL